MKSIVRLDLVLLRVQLKLAIYSLKANMNLLALLLLMGMIICLCKELLVVMLILGLSLSELLKINLLSFTIFLFKSSRKFSLILRILSMFLDEI